LLKPEASEFGNFIIQIRKKGFLRKFFSKEKIVIGKKKIDSLFINSDRHEIAADFLRNYIDFLVILLQKEI